MARAVKAKFGKKSVTLKATFAAAERICEDVADLMLISREAQTAIMFASRGIPYQPKWSFTVGGVIDILAIGADEAGADLSRDDIEAAAVEMGLDAAQGVATQYLQLFFSEPETKPDEGADTSTSGK